ncbi:T9SS type A sorting domain-containing protein [Porphyromonas uenonis]|uniref:T9SS type A sorting domain-containing protein n=1 Tax=Porphyromonas uenonis TaxID=281920 RepID=UPI001EE27291|nr:T9SS type A sorting domain-containing protein [Porphyromonas uenonis]
MALGKGFTPKVIRPEEMLVVGYRLQTRAAFDRDVAMIDPTPATEWSDRHNVLSFDTHYWMPADIQGALPINGGALAIEFMIDDAAPGAPVDVTGSIARGFHPAQWPVVKEYIIYADGAEIGRTQGLSYTVTNATGKKYSVKPLYENGLISATSPVLATSDAVRVYPTICTDHLTIQTNGVTGSYQLYTLDGTRLSEGVLADRTIDTSSWAVGSYLLQVTLADGTTTLHRIVKR